MSRTKKFFYNSMSTAAYQMIIMIAGFITPRIMLKYYGSEINGLVSSVNQFIVYFNLVEAGLSGAAIYALYKPLAEKNYKVINGVISAAKKFYTQSGYIFISLTIGLATFYPLFVKTDVLTQINIVLLVLILGSNGALEFFTLSKYRVLLTADQKTYVISLSSMVHIIINTLIVVVLGTMKVNIVTLRLVALFSIFLRSFILMIYVRMKYTFINFTETPNTQALDKRWDALYSQIIGAIHNGAPVIILTLVTRNLMIVSVYTIFNMITASLNGILSIFKSGLAASFGDVIAKNENKILQKAYSEFEFVYYAIITIVYSIASITIMPFIRIYTSGITDINYDMPLLGILFVLNGLLYNLKTPQGMLIISAGMFREIRLQITIQGAIAVILGFILSFQIGIYGVLIASIISNLYRDIDVLYFVPRNITKLPVIQTAKRMARITLSIIVIWIPFIFINLNPKAYFEWAIQAVIVATYACIVVALMNYFFDREAFNGVYQRVIKITKKMT